MSIDLTKLNTAQKQAVTHDQGPAIIIAGAGTGKTTVITQRIAYLIEKKKAKPEEILAVTFTEKAAGEMIERVDQLLPLGYSELWIHTFHGFAEKVLQDYAIDIGLPNDFKILDKTGAWLLVRQNLDKFDLDYYQPLGNPTKFIHALLNHFSRCKDEVVYPADYLKYAEDLHLNTDQAGDREEIKLESARAKEVADAYHIYQQLLLDNNALDFGDMINYTLQLFQKRPHILKKFREQFKYILVDEFQDTNWAQYELIKLLAAPKNNLMVVGDDDQCLPGTAKVLTLQGNKKIKDIKEGEEVLTAVGKGYIGVSKISRKFINHKDVNYLTFITDKGKKITVTDNHKMFCRIPAIGKSGYWYVYLMYRQDLGWRLGITNDLATRLRLERSADKILAVRGFLTEKEARYFEVLWSVKYEIPTVCFKTSGRNVIFDDHLLKKFYSSLDTDKAVGKLARNLNIDLNSHHFSLGGVVRGQKQRVKVYLDLCYRRHSTKGVNKVLRSNKILHMLSLETSDKDIVRKVKNLGYQLTKAKAGWRLRMASQDIRLLKKHLAVLEKNITVLIETRFQVGKLNKQCLNSLLMPAKNVQLGMYLPTVINNQVIYDKVVNIKTKQTKDKVYDLEIANTHNFIADDIVVHNSVYKFRGAAVSNILGFQHDYAKNKPKLVEIFLTDNYRSGQKILDVAYNFIQLNNPDRLEAQLKKGKKKLNKKLKSHFSDKGEIKVLSFADKNSEVDGILNKIIDLKKKDKDLLWSDFAILVRANDQAQSFVSMMRKIGLPHQFLASRGLYAQDIVLDIIAYLKLLDNYHESPALFRILNLSISGIDEKTLINLNHLANKKSWSLFAALQNYSSHLELATAQQRSIREFLDKIKEHTELAKHKSVSQVIYQWLEDSGYLEVLTLEDTQYNKEQLHFLNQFFRKIRSWEEEALDINVHSFLAMMDLELESGEQGALQPDVEATGPESVKVMTVHGAKGLEFKYVFISNLVHLRFPSTERRDPITLPEEFIKERLPLGDAHLQEERRLFYVGLTRTKLAVYLTWAKDYGGKVAKKPSRFLEEIKIAAQEIKPEQIKQPKEVDTKVAKAKYALPKVFSFSQLKAWQTCPRQYYYSHVIKLRGRGKAQFSFGKTMHSTLYKFFQAILNAQEAHQTDLFGKKQQPKNPTQDDLLKFYEEAWIDDWYNSPADKEKYRQEGVKILKEYYNKFKNKWPLPLFLEKGFTLKVGEYSLRGVFDRVDANKKNQWEIIDYKTGRAKDDKISWEDKKQLLIYQIAAEEIFKTKIKNLTFYYLNNNSPVSFVGTQKEIDKTKEWILETISKILTGDFTATPGFQCQTCDFNKICPFAQQLKS